MNNLDDFTQAYIECALWSSFDESDEKGGNPLDANYSVDDIAPDSLDDIIEDCQAFQEANRNDITNGPLPPLAHHHNPPSAKGQAGFDFWLTRNGHEVGFWDGDWPEPAATRLIKASKTFGGYSLYVGDDGAVHGI